MIKNLENAREGKLFNLLEGEEDISRRELNVKHFNLGEGRHQAVLYDAPVHYRNENGDMVEIDNNLVEDTVNGRKVYRNVSNLMKVEFPANAADGDLVKITKAGKTLTWGLDGDVNMSNAQVTHGDDLLRRELIASIPDMKNRLAESELPDAKVMSTKALVSAVAKSDAAMMDGLDNDAFIEVMTAEDPSTLSLEKLNTALRTPIQRRMSRAEKQAEIMYPNLLPGVTARYTIVDGIVKEDIVVADESALKKVAIRLPIGYNYSINEDQSVYIADGDEVPFTFDPPKVYDVEGNEEIAKVELTHLENYILLTYVLSPEFMEKAVYPVTIDPVARTDYKDETAVTDCFVRSSQKDIVVTQDTILRCGYDGGEEFIPLIRFNQLVKLNAADTMLSAYVKLTANYRQSNTYLACHKIKEMWYETGDNHVSWNSLGLDTDEPAIDSTILSYISEVQQYDQYFDITELCQEWYHLDGQNNQQNFGVAIRYARGVNVSNQHIHWKATNGHTSDNPRLVINYISHAGVEGWWQYESMSAGRAGTANVDIYNGNLVFTHPDVSSTGNLMPVSVSHTYNSCLATNNEYYCGSGWRHSLQQSLHIEKINSDTYYVWTDGDGTEHFFKKKSSTPYVDSEGMQLKMTFSDNIARITSKDDTRMEFPKPPSLSSSETVGPKYYLTCIKDALKVADDTKGSSININYVNTSGTTAKILSVTDGAGRSTTFTYNSSDLLSRITAPNGTYVSFTYSAGKLLRVTYSDLESTQRTVFAYTGNLLTSAKNYDSIKVNIVYGDPMVINPDTATDPDNHDELTRRVISLETVRGSVKGAKQKFEYLRNITKVTSIKSTANDNDGKTITYQFNDSGNVTCMFDELGYAQATTYSSTIPNTEEQSSKLQRAVMNYCKSIDFSNYWTKTGSGTATINTTTRCLGMQSVLLTGSSVFTCSNIFLPDLNDGGPSSREYTFSAYVKRTGTVTGDAFIRLTAGNSQYESRHITTNTDNVSGGPNAEGWERLYVSGIIGPNTTTKLQLIATGTAYFACPQLELGPIPNRVNLVVNGDFSVAVINTAIPDYDRYYPAYWSTQNGVADIADNRIIDGVANNHLPPVLTGNAVQLTSVPSDTDVAFQQRINVKGDEGDVFVLGGWVSSESTAYIPTEDERHNAPCIVYRYIHGSTIGRWRYLEFNREWVGWQFGCWPIVATDSYTAIDIRIDFSKNAQKGMFSNIFMYREQFGESFAYDSNKNVTSVENLAKTQSKMTYDSAHNLTSYIQPGAGSTEKYTFSFGDSTSTRKKHLLQTSTTPEGVKQTFAYDDKGNQTMAKTVNGSTAVIGSKTSYVAEGADAPLPAGVSQNYVRRSYDARGNAVVKTVNETDYTLTSVQDPSGQVVSYTYDNAKRVTEVSSTASSKTYKNEYTYENDRIKTVKHNTTSNTTCDVVYTFGYDVLGRKTTVSVGNEDTSAVLSTNVYKTDRSGLLDEVQYGNGGKVKYEYDDFDRLTGVKYDNETNARYTYDYGANGAVARVKDNHLNQTKQVEYDLAERPCQATIIQHDAQNGDSIAYRTTLKYDDRSRLERFSEQVPGGNHTTAYTYDKDNRTTQLLYDGTPKVEYTYDALGRIQTRKATNGSAYTSNYSFVAGDTTLYGTGATTPLVSSITQGSGTNAINFSYTYDVRGNILTETHGGKTRSYVYDAIGQLVRVNDPWDTESGTTGTTWVYSYDRGGNILKKKRYAYTTGSVGTVLDTITYGYDSVWKDKLTSYDGHTYTYDGIGNPLIAGNREYTWQAGRQLSYLDDNGIGIAYSYNSDGLRVQKVVNGDWYPETYKYTYHGKLLTHLTIDYTDLDEVEQQDNLHFFYDAQSRPAMVKYNGVMYTYVHNLQGDIVAILNASGTKVVEYKYDAWGNPIAMSGSMLDTLGYSNPFRYRGYVYDYESGLYYLRSRYYDPVVGRFVNADSLLGKVAGIISHNSFAYCQNNPTGLCDPDGNDPWWRIIPDWGYIHRQVQHYLKEKYNFITEVEVQYPIRNVFGITLYKKGRIDLIGKDGNAYEVKPNNKRAITKGVNQLGNYLRGTVSEGILDEGSELIVGGMQFSESFISSDGLYNIDITSPLPGIIAYNFDVVTKVKDENSDSIISTLQNGTFIDSIVSEIFGAQKYDNTAWSVYNSSRTLGGGAGRGRH